MRDAGNAVKDYGLDLTLVEGSTAGMTAALKAGRRLEGADRGRDPGNRPGCSEFDLKFLEDPASAFPPPQGYWIGQKGFSEANPNARELIASVSCPTPTSPRSTAP